MAKHIIRCRAQLEPDCYDGEAGTEPMSGDGTFNGETIVCDACYCRLMPFTPSGAALNEEIPAAITAYRGDGS